ncbi:MAG: RluA family pseudouridine synthase [Deltaproteobacteria bacterium]|nr:RluA family pseudouridine synthase [Deltaproteobacteria bacterium]
MAPGKAGDKRSSLVPAGEETGNEGGRYFFPVGREEAGIRLDVFLSRQGLSLSRSQIKKTADAGKITVNGVPARAGRQLREGDEVVFEKPPVAAYDVLPEDIPLVVVYEDPSLLVVDKPAGMVVHPAAGNYRGTLVNALLFHCRDLSGIGGVLRPGIVHRLDKGTSGLLVVAKSDAAHRGLAAQFKGHEVKKTYRALVCGNVKEEEGVINMPVGRDMVDRKKMSTRSRRGKEALTGWRVGRRYGAVTLLDVDIETGRTHQIRVHLAAKGHPVVGDSDYGGTKRARTAADMTIREKLRAVRRSLLHSSRLAFTHPVTGKRLSFSSPLPEDMKELCDFLESYLAR